MTEIISRASWDARPRKGTPITMGTIYGVTIHWNGPGMKNYTHGSCDDRIRGMQNYHMDGHGWSDIGYNFIVCRHGFIYRGRGERIVGAHAGESNIGGNSHWYGVQAMIGTGDTITPELLRGLKEAVAHCCKYGAGIRVNGHRDHHSTDCPGNYLYAWINNGMPLTEVSPPVPTPPQEDKMEYSSFGNSESSAKTISPGEWTDLVFDTEYADPDNQHGSGAQPTVLLGDKFYTLSASVQLAQDDGGDIPTGSLVQMRVAEYKYVPSSGSTPAHDELLEAGGPQTTTLSTDSVAKLGDVGHVQDGRKLRIQVRHELEGVTKAIGARAALLWQDA